MDIDESFSNVGIYETPYFAEGSRVGSRPPVIKFKEIMHKSDTVLIIFENISAIHTAIKSVIYLHRYRLYLFTHMGVYEPPIWERSTYPFGVGVLASWLRVFSSVL